MLSGIRAVAIGNALKATEAFNAGYVFVAFCCVFVSSLTYVPTTARNVCLDATRDKIASIIVYKAKKADVKARKTVKHTRTHTHVRTHTHEHTRTCAHTHTRTCAHTHTNTHTRAHAHEHTYTFARTGTHTRTCARTRAHTCTLTHTHIQPGPKRLPPREVLHARAGEEIHQDASGSPRYTRATLIFTFLITIFFS